MKSIRKIRSAALVGLCALSMALPQEKQGIKDIVNPYLGVYACTRATLEGRSILSSAERLRIELKKDGVYTLFYQGVDGKRVQRTGTYAYDAKKKEIYVVEKGGSSKKQAFTLCNGRLDMQVQIGEKLLCLTFAR